MAFRLKKTDRSGNGIPGLIRGQIDSALDELTSPKSDDSIHAIRKRCKRIRAVLRLMRDELGDAVYRRENHCYRDIAEPLAGARDATVLAAAFDTLTDELDERGIPRERLQRARTALEDDRRRARSALSAEFSDLEAVVR